MLGTVSQMMQFLEAMRLLLIIIKKNSQLWKLDMEHQLTNLVSRQTLMLHVS